MANLRTNDAVSSLTEIGNSFDGKVRPEKNLIKFHCSGTLPSNVFANMYFVNIFQRVFILCCCIVVYFFSMNIQGKSSKGIAVAVYIAMFVFIGRSSLCIAFKPICSAVNKLHKLVGSSCSFQPAGRILSVATFTSSSFIPLSGERSQESKGPDIVKQDLQAVIQGYQGQSHKRILEETVKFPSKFMIKIIGNNEGDFANDVLRAISKASGVPVNELCVATRENGKFMSITINPVFPSAKSIYATYSELSNDKRVKFVL